MECGVTKMNRVVVFSFLLDFVFVPSMLPEEARTTVLVYIQIHWSGGSRIMG